MAHIFKRAKQKLRLVKHSMESKGLYPAFLSSARSKLSFSPTYSRGQLLMEAKNGNNEKAIAIVNHLRRLRNYKSAAAAAELVDPHALKPRNFFALVQAFFSGMDGVRGDALLDGFLHQGRLEHLSPANQMALADVIARSGVSRDLKLRRLKTLEDAARSEESRRHIRFHEFGLRLSLDKDFDVVGYAELDRINFDRPGTQLRYVPHLKALGFEDEACALLRALYDHHGTRHPGVLQALLKFNPRWPGISINDLPSDYYSRPESLQFLSENKNAGDDFRAAFDRSRETVIASYKGSDVYTKDRILGRLLRLDMIDEIDVFSCSDRDLPDTVLPPQVAAGLRAFVNDDYLSAKERFLGVIEEDPGDATASQGLRLTLPRAGGDMSTIVSIRNSIGYGANGAG
ncbi:MAG TPA: hypothetical protein VD840_00905, partial [Sinorhizobium sp.]|nr:hypothetical protein [Sinorhizobium sp.]